MASEETSWRRWLAALGAAIDPSDAAFFGGLALVAVGFIPVWWPASLLVPGFILIAVSVFGVRNGPARED